MNEIKNLEEILPNEYRATKRITADDIIGQEVTILRASIVNAEFGDYARLVLVRNEGDEPVRMLISAQQPVDAIKWLIANDALPVKVTFVRDKKCILMK